jgi:hypothetical protein
MAEQAWVRQLFTLGAVGFTVSWEMIRQRSQRTLPVSGSKVNDEIGFGYLKSTF